MAFITGCLKDQFSKTLSHYTIHNSVNGYLLNVHVTLGLKDTEIKVVRKVMNPHHKNI